MTHWSINFEAHALPKTSTLSQQNQPLWHLHTAGQSGRLAKPSGYMPDGRAVLTNRVPLDYSQHLPSSTHTIHSEPRGLQEKCAETEEPCGWSIHTVEHLPCGVWTVFKAGPHKCLCLQIIRYKRTTYIIIINYYHYYYIKFSNAENQSLCKRLDKWLSWRKLTARVWEDFWGSDVTPSSGC